MLRSSVRVRLSPINTITLNDPKSEHMPAQKFGDTTRAIRCKSIARPSAKGAGRSYGWPTPKLIAVGWALRGERKFLVYQCV